jgi:hypothetical protein
MIVAQPPSFTSLSTTPRNSISHALPSPSILFSSNFSPRFHSARRNSRFFSSLRTLELSCRIFCSHRPLFSMACALFDKNTGTGVYSFRKLRLDHHICFRFRIAFVFKSLQIPFPATPLFSHPYKTIGRVGPFLSIPCSRVTVHGTSHAFSFVCRLFGAFFALAPFVFNRLQPLFKNHPGGGTSSTISGVALLRSVSFGAPQSRLCDASSRYILGPSLNMRSP